MKKILITCVNYNSYDCLANYIDSIDIAAGIVAGACSVNIVVADNTETNYQEIKCSCQNVDVKLFPFHKNHGYMGGVVLMLKELGFCYVKGFDYVIVSNVDLSID